MVENKNKNQRGRLCLDMLNAKAKPAPNHSLFPLKKLTIKNKLPEIPFTCF